MPDSPRVSVSGSSVRVSWFLADLHPDQRRLVGFQVHFRRDHAQAEWISAGDQLGPHVRATTVKSLVADNRYNPFHNVKTTVYFRYMFRVAATMNDGTSILSSSSAWITIASEKSLSSATLPAEPMVVPDVYW